MCIRDRSQSMHDHASGNDKTKNMRPPTDLAGRGDGNYFVSGVDESGYYYWNADQNKINNTNSIFGGFLCLNYQNKMLLLI